MSTPHFQFVSNACVRHVCFNEALDQYKLGKTVECRLINSNGAIIGWEKYHISDGLEMALEFDEIINGMWFIVEYEI